MYALPYTTGSLFSVAGGNCILAPPAPPPEAFPICRFINKRDAPTDKIVAPIAVKIVAAVPVIPIAATT